MSTPDREPGFYWVRLDGEWIVTRLYRDHGGQERLAFSDSCTEEAVSEIGPPVLSHDEARRLKALLAVAEEEKAELERRLSYALGEIDELREKLRAVKPPMTTAVPRDT